MSQRAEFHVMGEPLDGAPLHYTASGLDYVYLQNGFMVEDDPDYGRILTIRDVDALHRAIGLHVITRRRALTGAEFKFLRKQMKMKQKELADDWGVSEQTIANYEKEKRIPPTSDRLMRITFLVWITPEDMRAEFVKRITERIQARQKPKAAPISALPSGYCPEIVKQWQGGRVSAASSPIPA